MWSDAISTIKPSPTIGEQASCCPLPPFETQSVSNRVLGALGVGVTYTCVCVTLARLLAVHCQPTCRMFGCDCECGFLAGTQLLLQRRRCFVDCSSQCLNKAHTPTPGRAGGGLLSFRQEWRASAFPTRFSRHRPPTTPVVTPTTLGPQPRGHRKIVSLSIASITYSGPFLERKLPQQMAASVEETLPPRLHQTRAEV